MEYSVYTNNSTGVFTMLRKLADNDLDSKKMYFKYVIQFLVIVNFCGGGIFLIYFLWFQKQLIDFVRLCFEFNESNINTMETNIDDLEKILNVMIF